MISDIAQVTADDHFVETEPKSLKCRGDFCEARMEWNMTSNNYTLEVMNK